MITKGHEETFEFDGYVHYLDLGNNLSNYTFKMCSLSYINYTSIKLLKIN